MIRYTLTCAADHAFESWFRSAGDFDSLAAAGQLTCPDCGSANVKKAPMAPRVRPDRSRAAAPADPSPDTPAPAPPSGVPATAPALPAEAVRKLKEHVEATSEYVGKDFVQQARAMHDGDAPERAIYGEARIEDAKKLVEDGIPALPLPFIPKRKTN